jgi:hypothetical protein
MTSLTGVTSLDELRRAFWAMRTDGSRTPPAAASAPRDWAPVPGEQVVLVCGCGGASGATTVALGIATAAGRARVVETSGGTASGLAYAASAELGTAGRGWLRGSRDQVIVERQSELAGSPDHLPKPARTDLPVTVIDSAWEVSALLGAAGWLGDLARSAGSVVLVARATIPGLRRLEADLAQVGSKHVVAATVGARRWPRPVEQAAGMEVRRLRAEGQLVLVPEVPALAISGLAPDPLPQSIIRAARTLLTLLEGRQS